MHQELESSVAGLSNMEVKGDLFELKLTMAFFFRFWGGVN